MVIRKTRIRSLTSYLPRRLVGKNLVAGVTLASVPHARVENVGFTQPFTIGDHVLPDAGLGPTARRNAEGESIVHRDRPMETHYRQAEWHWKEFRGRYDSVDRSKIVDIPYQRYPRTLVPPLGLEFTMVALPDGTIGVVIERIRYDEAHAARLLQAINLFLEAFGHCEIFEENLTPMVVLPIRQLNWRILPAGRHPWPQLKPSVQRLLDQSEDGNRAVVEFRLEHVNSFGPEFVAVGEAGFRGYLIFGFPAANTFVLESSQTNNATYILGSDWATLSGLTKADLLNGNLHRARIIHRKSWQRELASQLGTARRAT